MLVDDLVTLLFIRSAGRHHWWSDSTARTVRCCSRARSDGRRPRRRPFSHQIGTSKADSVPSNRYRQILVLTNKVKYRFVTAGVDLRALEQVIKQAADIGVALPHTTCAAYGEICAVTIGQQYASGHASSVMTEQARRPPSSARRRFLRHQNTSSGRRRCKAMSKVTVG